MHVLTKNEIRFITETVDKAGITISHLHEDLVDHICCEIEYEIENGLTFRDAFEKIKTVVGIKDLQQVQINTLLLIDKNYRIMKTIMKVSGVVSTTLLMFGSLFKIMHWPLATMLLIIGFILMSFVFLPSAMYIINRENKEVKKPLLNITAFLGSFGFIMGSFFKIMHWPGTAWLLILGMGILSLLFMPALMIYLREKAENRKEKKVYTSGIISGMIYMLAILFKMMHWPGASIMLMLSSIALVVLFIIPYTVYHFKDEEFVKAKFVYLIAAFTWLMLFTMLLALNVEISVLRGFDQVDEKLHETQAFYELKNKKAYLVLKDSSAYEEMQEISKNADDLVLYAHNLKLQVFRKYYEGEVFDESLIVDASTVNLKNWNDGGRSNTSAPQFVMIGGENIQGKALELKAKIEGFKEGLLLKLDSDSEKSKLINEILKTEVPDDNPQGFSTWEEYCFKRVTIVGCINILSSIQRDVRIAESEVLDYLTYNY